VWVAVYALLLIWAIHYLRRQWAIRGSDLARTLLVPFAGTGVLVSVVAVARLVIGEVNSWVQVEVVAAALGLTYAGLLLPAWRRVAA
jgi:predicted transporter